MSDYRRALLKGGTFFFTAVTYKRYPIFVAEASIELLRRCFQIVMKKYPFRIDAIVVLPDHLHTIWTLPDFECDFSTRWKLIKGTYSRYSSSSKLIDISESMRRKKEKGIWQRRFWEHTIRDEEDYNHHCDYIHYNPVKHGLVSSPGEWKNSSFSEFVEKGFYSPDWGENVSRKVIEMDFE